MSVNDTSWCDRAKAAAAAHLRQEQEADERDAQATVDYLLRAVERMGLQDRGYPERIRVDGNQVTYVLPGHRPFVHLRTEVSEDRPVIHLWAQNDHSAPWLDLGPVETITDVGLALTGHAPEPPAEDMEPSVGDMLYQVLEGLVRDVVHDVLDGRLGDGTA